MSSTHTLSRATGHASDVADSSSSAHHSLSGSSHFDSALFPTSSSVSRSLASTGCGINGASDGSIADQTGFEDADGNLKVDTAGCTDWNSFGTPTWTGNAPFQTTSGTLGALTFVGATDAVNSTSDSIYAGGVKQDTVCPGTVTGKANDKADLAAMYVAGERINGQTYLFLSWERQLDTTVNSDVFVSFEFDQGNVSCGANSPFTQRTVGDLLFDYNFQSGNSTITAEQWDGTTWQPLKTPPFEASVNAGTVTDTINPNAPVDLTKFEFGEAGINLSDVDLSGNGGRECETFGSVLGGSRTSKSGDTAQLKDFVGPAPIDVSNCASPTVATQTTLDSMSLGDTQTVGDTATLSNGNNPTGSVSFQLYSDSNCQTPVAGVSGSAPLDGNGVATFAGAPFTPSKAGTYYWGVSYPGDDSNNPVSACGGANEEIVVNAPSLSVTKTADAPTVNAGDPIGFTIKVANGGPGTAKGVTLDDPLPAGATVAGWTLDSNTGSANCSITGAAGSQELKCSAVDLASGASYTLHISAATSFTACTKYDNTATVSASNAPDASGSDSIQCQKPSLSVTKTADKATVNAGDPIGFTIKVANGGPGVAKNVTLDDPLPAGATVAGWTLDSNSGSANCSITGAPGSQELKCSAVDLASGASYTLHISAATSFMACTKYDNTATASASNAPDAQGSDSIQCQKPDLTVVKKADNAVVNAGDPLGFTITVSNGGPGTAKGVTLDDPLPAGTTAAGWTLDSNSGSANCSISNGSPQHLTCSAVDLDAGASYVLHISAATSFAACTKYDNTATASASNAPDAQGSDSIQCNKPDLSITKKADKKTVDAGDPIGFTITVSNGGPGTAKGVTLDDPLPAGTTAAGWTIDTPPSAPPTCSITGAPGSQELKCSAVDLASGDSYTVHVTAGTSFANCTKYDNTATASASNAPDVQGSDSIQCQKPDLTVVKKADNAVVNAGDPLGFTITVSNGGPGTAKGVTLDDPLPAGTTAAGWSIDTAPSAPPTCSITGALGSQDLKCTPVDLAPGDSYTVHVTAGTSVADCTKYDNTATASASNAPDAQDSASITCLKPGLNVTKKADAATVDAGDPIGFSIEVSNGGPGVANDVTLKDPLPAGTTAAGWTLDSNSGSANCAINGPVGNQELDCSAIDMAAGDTYTVHISAATSFAACTDYDNTATASASNAPDAQDSASITCQAPDLEISKSADHATVDAGDPLGFSITVSNGGPGTAKGVTLDDPLPAGTTNSGWTLDSNSGTANCAITGAVGSQSLHCSAIDLAKGDSYTVHVSAGTSFLNCTDYDNTATAHATNAPDASDSASIACRKPSLSVNKTADKASVNAGDPIGFTVTVSNGGPGTAKGVTLSDPLPAGTATAWSIDKAPTAPPTCSITGALGSQTLHCSAVDLGAEDSYTVHVKASTSQAACTTYDNTATAHASNAPDEEDSASITCNPAQVSITKKADHSAPVNAGDQIGFTVEVKNTGSGDATGVKLSDPLPAGSGSGVSWAIDSSVGSPAKFVLSGAKGSQTLSLASTTLPAGADYKVHITAATSQTECSTYDNTATLTTGNAGNPNPASAEESCAFHVDLSITKSGSPATQTLGDGNITWTMVVKNNGPDTDTGVKVSDPMPAGNTFVSATTTQGTCTGGAILNCNIGTMAADATVTITLVTTPSTPGAQTNTAVVSGDRPETNVSNNTATATVQVKEKFTPPPCIAVSRITPGHLIVGRKTTVKIHLTQGHKAAKGTRVRIKGAGINVKTKPSNAKGIIKHVLKMKKQGILTFTPIVSKNGASCNNKRIGVRGVFTPPVTG